MKTILFYRQCAENLIVPCIGTIRLDHLNADQIRGMMARLTKAGKARQTVNHALAVLRTALTSAFNDHKIPYNPALNIKKLKVEKKIVVPLTQSEAAALVWSVEGHRLEALYHLSFLGLRLGELLGLRIADIDVRARTLTITQNAVELEGGRMELDTPKSKNARRTLPLSDRLIALLRRRLEMLLVERGGAGWQEQGLLFPNEKGLLISQRNMDRALKSMLNTADIVRPWTWHSFRHNAVSWLTDQGTSDELIKGIVGHADQSVTDRYRHISPEALREPLEALERALLAGQHQPSEEQAKDRTKRLNSGAPHKQKREG